MSLASVHRAQSLALEQKKHPCVIGLPGRKIFPPGHFAMSCPASQWNRRNGTELRIGSALAGMGQSLRGVTKRRRSELQLQTAVEIKAKASSPSRRPFAAAFMALKPLLLVA